MSYWARRWLAKPEVTGSNHALVFDFPLPNKPNCAKFTPPLHPLKTCFGKTNTALTLIEWLLNSSNLFLALSKEIVSLVNEVLHAMPKCDTCSFLIDYLKQGNSLKIGVSVFFCFFVFFSTFFWDQSETSIHLPGLP